MLIKKTTTIIFFNIPLNFLMWKISIEIKKLSMIKEDGKKNVNTSMSIVTNRGYPCHIESPYNPADGKVDYVHDGRPVATGIGGRHSANNGTPKGTHNGPTEKANALLNKEILSILKLGVQNSYVKEPSIDKLCKAGKDSNCSLTSAICK